MVQLGTLAPLNAGLARKNGGARAFLPHEHTHHESGYHHALGRKNGPDGSEQHG